MCACSLMCDILYDTTTAECTLFGCKYGICASGWMKSLSAQVAMGETTTCGQYLTAKLFVVSE